MEATILKRHRLGGRPERKARSKHPTSRRHSTDIFNFQDFANGSSDEGREADEDEEDADDEVDKEKSIYCYENPVLGHFHDHGHFKTQGALASRMAVSSSVTAADPAMDPSSYSFQALGKTARSNSLPALFPSKSNHSHMDIFHMLDRVMEDEDKELQKIEDTRQQNLAKSNPLRKSTPMKQNRQKRPKQPSSRLTRIHRQLLQGGSTRQNDPHPHPHLPHSFSSIGLASTGGSSSGNQSLQLQPLTQSLQELSHQHPTEMGDSPTTTSTTHLPQQGSGLSDSPDEDEARKHSARRGSWLWSLIRGKAKQVGGLAAGNAGSATFPEVGVKSKKTKGLPMARLFARGHGDHSGARAVFTLTDGDSVMQDDVVPELSSSLESTAGIPVKGKECQHGVPLPQISLRRRTSGYEDDVALLQLSSSPSAVSGSSRSPSPLVQLSGRDLFAIEEDAASITSSMTSTSVDSSESQSDSSDSDKALTKLKETDNSFTAGSSAAEREGGRSAGLVECREREQKQSHLAGSADLLASRRSQSAGTFNLKDLEENEFEGPHGKLFTAKLFNRIGRKGTLSNVTHVSHVYKGTILVTDLLQGKILFAARSGRWDRVFVTETGSEPWCACVTPRGYVAVTLRRMACVTVWSGNGTLVREFGQGVLECPTGLTCDRQSRFIVTDEKTNRVAIFSPAGEFLRYLCHLPATPQRNGKLPSRKDSNESAKKVNSSKSDSNSSSNSSNNDGDSSSDANEEEEVSADEAKLMKASSYGKGAERKHGHENPAVSFAAATSKGSQGRYVTRQTTDPRGTDPNRDEKTAPATTAVGNGDLTTTSASAAKENDSEPYIFSDPRYVCVTASGKIVVSDSGSHAVRVFTPEGTYLHAIGRYGNRDGQLKVPYGVCSDQQENVYIADHYNDRVSVFSIDGVFLQHVLTATSGLSRPKSVAIRPAHVRKLYIAHGGLRSTEILVYRLVTGQPNISFKCDL